MSKQTKERELTGKEVARCFFAMFFMIGFAGDGESWFGIITALIIGFFMLRYQRRCMRTPLKKSKDDNEKRIVQNQEFTD